MNASRPQSSADLNQLRRVVQTEWKIEKLQCREYAHFFKVAWHEMEPSQPLRWNWHIQVLCDELQKQVERIAARQKKEYDLIINIPPGTSKSSICRRLFVPYTWTRFPGIKFLSVSFDYNLSLEHAVDSRTLIMSDWYQRYWGKVFKLKDDQNAKGFFKTTEQGFLLSASVNSSRVGRRVDIAIDDDPNDPKQDESEKKRMQTINFFTKVQHKRINMPEIGMSIIVQQRTHDSDLTGYLLNNFPKDYKLICIPGEESDEISPPELRQHYMDKLFDPINYPRTVIEKDRIRLGPDFSGQIMQRPTPDEGNMFKKQNWRFWVPRGMLDQFRQITVRTIDNLITCQNIELPERFEDKIISWDMGLKGKSDNDFSVGQVWGRFDPLRFLLDLVRGRFDSLQCEREARILKSKHPDTSIVLIEDEAAGSSTIVRIQDDISGVQGEIPHGTKRNRARGMAAAQQSGHIVIPHPDLFPWVQPFIEEYAVFDKGSFDDQVDTGTQAFNHFLRSRRVFSEFTGKTAGFVVGWHELTSFQKPFIAQYTVRSGQCGVIVGLFHQQTGILRVLAAAESKTAEPKAVKDIVGKLLDSAGAKHVGHRVFQWYGNDTMFTAAAGDMAEQYMTKGVFLRDLPGYTEPGAIISVIRRFVEKKIIIHVRAAQLVQDLMAWTWKDEKNPEDGFYLARALCLASEAFREMAPKQVKQPKRDYTVPVQEYGSGLERLKRELVS